MRYTIDSIRAEQAYQHTACLIMLKAIESIYGEKTVVRIGNSLNQGFFVYFGETDQDLTSSEVEKINRKMRSIVADDVIIEKITVTNREAERIWSERGYKFKAKLFRQADPDAEVEICKLLGYYEYFYGGILPSTGLVELFEVRPYRRGFLLRLPSVLHPDSLAPYRDDDKLYEAFACAKRLRKTTDIDYLADLNERIASGLVSELIADGEASQEKEIRAVARLVIESGRRLILIAGPSSSGKTTFAHKLCSAIEAESVAPLYLGTDDYFLERAETPVGPDGTPNYEGLDALDLHLFSRNMQDLLDGKTVDAPQYDFVEGRKKFGVRNIKAEDNQMIVIEGIHSLNDALTPDISRDDKFKIYISPLTKLGFDRHNRLSTTDSRMLRRMIRDNQFRATDAAGTIKSWSKVRAGESVNIFPYSSSADYIFNSSLVYETPLLKHYAEPLLLAITEDSEAYSEAQRLLEFLKYFRKIDDSSAIPEGALIREFIGPKK